MALLTEIHILNADKISSKSLGETLTKVTEGYENPFHVTAIITRRRLEATDWEVFESDEDKIERLERELQETKDALKFSTGIRHDLVKQLDKAEIAALERILIAYNSGSNIFEAIENRLRWLKD
jgi:hypothetical protein